MVAAAIFIDPGALEGRGKKGRGGKGEWSRDFPVGGRRATCTPLFNFMEGKEKGGKEERERMPYLYCVVRKQLRRSAL